MPIPTKAYSASLNAMWVLLALTAQPAWAADARIYITNSAGDNVHVIDPVTNKVVRVIEGIEAAHGIAFSSDGTRVYLSNEADSTLDVVDQKAGQLIKKVPLSGHPNNIAVTRDGGRVVVAIARGPGALDVIDTKSLTKTKSIPTRGRLHNVYVTPDGKYAVSGSIPSKILTVFDLATEQIAWELQLDLGVRPMTFETNPDGSTRRIFVQLSRLNGFAVIDFAQRWEVDRITLPDQPSGFGEAENRLEAPSHGLGVTPDGKALWVTSIIANAVFAYSLPDLKLMGHVKLPEINAPGRPPISAVPNWVTFTPDSKTIYISGAAANAVSAIDTQALKLVAVIPVGQAPKRIGTLVESGKPTQ